MQLIEATIPPLKRQRCRSPVGAPTREFIIRDVKVQATALHVKVNPVAVPDKRQGTANRAFRGDVQDDGAVRRSAHPGVGDPHHVADPFTQEFRRYRHEAHLRHSWRADRAGVLQHQDAVCGHRQVRVVDPCAEIVD